MQLLTLEEMKNFLRIDYEEDDNTLQALGLAASSYLDNAIDDLSSLIKDEGTKERVKRVAFLLVQDWYDNRDQEERKEVSYTVRALLTQLQAAGGTNA